MTKEDVAVLVRNGWDVQGEKTRPDGTQSLVGICNMQSGKYSTATGVAVQAVVYWLKSLESAMKTEEFHSISPE